MPHPEDELPPRVEAEIDSYKKRLAGSNFWRFTWGAIILLIVLLSCCGGTLFYALWRQVAPIDELTR